MRRSSPGVLAFRLASRGAWSLLVGVLAAAALGASVPARGAAELFPGYPPITPHWAFEPWVWEDETNTRASTENLVQGYLDRDIPVGVVLIDSPWETHYNTLQWDPSRYPDPAAMLRGFHEKGLRVILWITGFINRDSPDYSDVKSRGYAANRGRDISWWQGTGVHLDFTNPAALQWWHGRMDPVLDMGVDGWKVDWTADSLPDPVSTSLGSLSRQDFKAYYYADFYDYSTGRSPQALVFARPYSSAQGGAGAPVSRLPAGWSGDFSGDFHGLAAQLEDVYESARRGYAAPGVEVGGFWDVPPTKDSLIRSAQLAALVPVMENGGNNGGESEHLPWYWDSQAVDIYRCFAALHSQLSPYLFSYSVEAHLRGKSILREPDPQAGQHKLGEELFVSAITDGGITKAVSFPAGATWVDYWDESLTYPGGSRVNYSAPLDRYPLFIKAGAVIPVKVKHAVTGHGGPPSAGRGTGLPVTLLVYPYGSSSFTFHRPLGEGVEYEDVRIQVDEAAGLVRVDGSSPLAYRLRVKSFAAPSGVSGADSWTYDTASRYVIVDRLGQDFTVKIRGLQGYGLRAGGSAGAGLLPRTPPPRTPASPAGTAAPQIPASGRTRTAASVRTVLDLSIGEAQTVILSDGSSAEVELLGVTAARDSVRGAVRAVKVRVQVNGIELDLPSGNYNLPVAVGGVQIDCPVTADYYENTKDDWWKLSKDARFRLWPAGAPLLEPGTFTFPLAGRFLAGSTQAGNEPAYVNGDEDASTSGIYYHWAVDLGGTEGMETVFSTTAGTVFMASGDYVGIRDARGWEHYYFHLKTVAVRSGMRVAAGQAVGVLGKEGASGGWAHLHYEIFVPLASGEYAIEDAYAYLWEAYLNARRPKILAVARPHLLLRAGETGTLDGTRSVSLAGEVTAYRWTFTDGASADGPIVRRVYSRPGTYTETLEVTDDRGNTAYDFMVVQVIDPGRPLPHTISANFYPTSGIRPGQPVTFAVRLFRTSACTKEWDFGDGSPREAVGPSDDYDLTTHSYAAPGDYIVTVREKTDSGPVVECRLWVRVEAGARARR